jgi:hypothetical protein
LSTDTARWRILPADPEKFARRWLRHFVISFFRKINPAQRTM